MLLDHALAVSVSAQRKREISLIHRSTIYEPQPEPRHIILCESRIMRTPHVPMHDQVGRCTPIYVALHVLQERACVHEHRVLEEYAIFYRDHLDTLAQCWNKHDFRRRTAVKRTRVDPDFGQVPVERQDGREVESSDERDRRRGIEYIEVKGRGRDKKCATTEKAKIANMIRKAFAR